VLRSSLIGTLPIVLLGIAIVVLIISVFVNWKINRVQNQLRELGKDYYEREKLIVDKYKSGKLTEYEYRREHNRLVSEMKEESRKFTD
jgi:uncharacterized membrane protein